MKLGSRIHAVAATAMLAAAGLAAGSARAGETPLPAPMSRPVVTADGQLGAAGATSTDDRAVEDLSAAGAPTAGAAGSSRFPDLRGMNLSLTPPTAFRLQDEEQSIDATAVFANERTVVPVPSPGWTGFAALAVLGLIGSRKAILRFVS